MYPAGRRCTGRASRTRACRSSAPNRCSSSWLRLSGRADRSLDSTAAGAHTGASEKERRMKHVFLAVIALLGAVTASAQAPVPEIAFDGNVNFLKLPADMNVGEVSGVAVNSKGDVAVFTRSNSAGGPAYGATASQVLLFDKTGKFIREIGKGLYAWSYAHAIRFEKDDTLGAIERGPDMIVRINPEGHVTMVFGRKKGASDDAKPGGGVPPPRPPVNGQFRQPTDVA